MPRRSRAKTKPVEQTKLVEKNMCGPVSIRKGAAWMAADPGSTSFRIVIKREGQEEQKISMDVIMNGDQAVQINSYPTRLLFVSLGDDRYRMELLDLKDATDVRGGVSYDLKRLLLFEYQRKLMETSYRSDDEGKLLHKLNRDPGLQDLRKLLKGANATWKDAFLLFFQGAFKYCAPALEGLDIEAFVVTVPPMITLDPVGYNLQRVLGKLLVEAGFPRNIYFESEARAASRDPNRKVLEGQSAIVMHIDCGANTADFSTYELHGHTRNDIMEFSAMCGTSWMWSMAIQHANNVQSGEDGKVIYKEIQRKIQGLRSETEEIQTAGAYQVGISIDTLELWREEAYEELFPVARKAFERLRRRKYNLSELEIHIGGCAPIASDWIGLWLVEELKKVFNRVLPDATPNISRVQTKDPSFAVCRGAVQPYPLDPLPPFRAGSLCVGVRGEGVGLGDILNGRRALVELKAVDSDVTPSWMSLLVVNRENFEVQLYLVSGEVKPYTSEAEGEDMKCHFFPEEKGQIMGTYFFNLGKVKVAKTADIKLEQDSSSPVKFTLLLKYGELVIDRHLKLEADSERVYFDEETISPDEALQAAVGQESIGSPNIASAEPANTAGDDTIEELFNRGSDLLAHFAEKEDNTEKEDNMTGRRALPPERPADTPASKRPPSPTGSGRLSKRR